MLTDELQSGFDKEQAKRDIISLVDPDVKKIIQDEKLKEREKWGAVFEVCVRTELANRNKPTIEQKETKEYKAQEILKTLLEEMYSDINIVLGSGEGNGENRPDGIVVGFEDKKIVIQKVIEMKSSSDAYEHAISEDQPVGTIKSLTKLVNIFNQIMRGDENKNILQEYPHLKNKEINSRDQRLNKIRNVLFQVKKILPEIDKIVFSENLEYHLIFPDGETVPNFTPDHLEQYFYAIPVTMENSIVSKTMISNLFLKYSSQNNHSQNSN